MLDDNTVAANMHLYVACLVILMPVVSVHGVLTSAQKQLFIDNGWTITEDGTDYIFEHSGVPDSNSYAVGSFPNRDNPNTIRTQNYRIYIPKNPTVAASSACTPAGYVGMSISGAAFFNPLTIEGKDAVTGECAELFDSCQGHPDPRGVYHYHQIPTCVESTLNNDEPIGIALDGYLLYLNKDETGNTLTGADLDECGGRTGSAGDYRYHMQTTYPYTIGCFKGEFSSRQTVRTMCLEHTTCGACAHRSMFALMATLYVLWKIFV